MATRTSFLRNPRYCDTPPARKHRTKSIGSAAAPVVIHSSMKPQPPSSLPIVAEPSEVVFSSYEVGGTYNQLLQLRNVSTTMRGLRLLPPASQYFHASLPRYPAATANDVAPGMAVEVALRFTPDSLADYGDVLLVVTQLGRLEVPLRGRRPPPVLTLPSALEMGDVLIGNTRRMQISFANDGGDGRFHVVPESLWPSAAPSLGRSGDLWVLAAGPSGIGSSTDRAAVVRDALAPFWIEPSLLNLPAGAAGSLAVEFAPTAVGCKERAFLLVCDNCQVRRYVVRGRGTDVDVRLEEEDGRPIEAAVAGGSAEVEELSRLQQTAASGSHQPPPIWLGEVVPGAQSARQIRVCNRTPLPLPFRWEVEGLAGQMLGAATSAASVFSLAPSSGVLQPGERLQLDIQFAPVAVGGAAARARLVVDGTTSAQRQGIITPAHQEQDAAAAAALASTLFATAGPLTVGPLAANAKGSWSSEAAEEQQQQAAATAGLIVAELVLQGNGAAASLRLDPPAIRFPGVLTCEQRVEAPLLLHNPTDAPVDFQFKAPSELGGGTLALMPSGGTVPPHSSTAITVVLQPSYSGAVRRKLDCIIRHGLHQTLLITAEVQEAEVAVAEGGGAVDLGLIRIGHSAAAELQLVNRSSFGLADWALEQLVGDGEDGSDGDLEKQVGMGSDTAATTTVLRQKRPQLQLVQLEPASGQLQPSCTCSVHVSCKAAVPGQHRMTLRLTSGRGAHTSCVEVLTTVVVPDVRLDPCKFELGHCFKGCPLRRSLQLTNTALLPCSFVFAMWQQSASGRLVPVPSPPVCTRGTVVSARLSPTQTAARTGDSSWPSTTAIVRSMQPVEGDDKSRLGVIGVAALPHVGVLQPGQMVKIRVNLDPQSEGPVRVFGICSVDGMTAPRGFALSGVVRGLRVGYQILSLPAWGAAGHPGLDGSASAAEVVTRRGSAASSAGRQQRWSTSGQALGHHSNCRASLPAVAAAKLGDEQAPLVVDFGVCRLGQAESRVVVLTNATSMAAQVEAWVDRHPCAAENQQLQWTVHTLPGAAGQRSSSSPGQSRCTLLPQASATGGGSAANISSGRSSPTRGLSSPPCHTSAASRNGPALCPWPRTAPGSPSSTGSRQHGKLTLSSQRGQLAPYIGLDSSGNQMMAARREQLETLSALGGSQSGKHSCQLLQTGRQPLALALAPAAGELAPDSSMAIEVVAFSALPGTYCDVLTVQVGDLPPQRIPMVVRVAGSPLILQKDRVLAAGISTHTASSSGSLSSSGGLNSSGGLSSSGNQSPAVPYGSERAWGRGRAGVEIGLQLGEVLPGAAQQRVFHVHNTSCAAVELHWEQQKTNTEAEPQQQHQQQQLVSSSSSSSSGGFDVQPADAVIQPGKLQPFTVRFSSSTSGHRMLHLVGTQRIVNPAAESREEQQQQTIAASLWPSGNQWRPVKLQLLGGFYPLTGPPPQPLPQLKLNAAAMVSPARLELATGEDGVKWSCASILAVQAGMHPAFLRTVTLCNPVACPLTFQLSVNGPFELVSAAASAPPPHTFCKQQQQQQSEAADASPGAAEDSSGRLICLPAQESVAVGIRFVPRMVQHDAPPAFADSQPLQLGARTMLQQLRTSSSSIAASTLKAAATAGAQAAVNSSSRSLKFSASMVSGASRGSGIPLSSRSKATVQSNASGKTGSRVSKHGLSITREDYDSTGSLTIAFANDEQQLVPLHAAMLHPAVVCSTAALEFGEVHPQAPKPLEVFLINPTTVDATWTMMVDSVAGNSKSAAAAASAVKAPTANGGSSMSESLPHLAPTDGRLNGGLLSSILTAAGGSAGAATNSSSSSSSGSSTFGAFTVSPATGVIPGRGLGMPHSQRVLITFAPPENKPASALLQVVVAAGRGCGLGVAGCGTFDETKEHLAHLTQL